METGLDHDQDQEIDTDRNLVPEIEMMVVKTVEKVKKIEIK